MKYTKFCVSDSYQNVRRLLDHAHTYSIYGHKLHSLSLLSINTHSHSYWLSCSHNVCRGLYNMNPIVTLQRYISLSLIARLCPTPEQTLCSPSLQALVALITLRVYWPPFITSKYQLTGCFTSQQHHRSAEEELKELGIQWCHFFPSPIWLFNIAEVMGTLTTKLSWSIMSICANSNDNTSCSPVSEADSLCPFPYKPVHLWISTL